MNGQLWIEHEWHPSLQRVNDASLMKTFIESEGATKGKLIAANHCRLYIRCSSIAELANIAGTFIPATRLNGEWRASSTLEWPNIPRPPPKCWTIFRWFIRKTIATSPWRHNQHAILDHPLGNWFQVPRNLRYELLRNQDSIFLRREENLIQFKSTNNPKIFLRSTKAATAPTDSHPIEAMIDGDEAWTSNRYKITPLPSESLPSSIDYNTNTNTTTLSGSDGSVDIVTGDRACAYCVQINGQRFGGARRYEASPYSTSLRSELEGAMHTLKIIKEKSIPKETAQYIDNSQTVDNLIEKYYTPGQMLGPEVDIVLACKAIQEDGISRPEWLRAHQDDSTPYCELPHPVQMNSDMDTAAKHSRIHDQITKPKPYRGSKALLIIEGRWVTTKYAEQIQDAVMHKSHIKFFLHKYKHLHDHHYDSIYWRGIGLARRRLTLSENIDLTKYMNGWLNSGRQKGHFGELPECPCCGWHEETQLHIFCCTHPQMIATRKKSFQQLRTYYELHKIPSTIYYPFIMICESTTNMDNVWWNSHQPDHLRQAIVSQEELGGEMMLRGYLVSEWLAALREAGADKPDQCMTHLHLGLWKILYPSIWEQRNTLLHGDESFTTKLERKNLTRELIEWKRVAGSKLGASQIYLIDYNIKTIAGWTLSTMQTTIDIIHKAAKNFQNSDGNKLQPLITKYYKKQNV